MDLNLQGKKVIIAGASRGIGLASAKAFAAEGCDVAICARGADGVNAALKEISGSSGKAIGEAVDIGDAEAYRAWVDRSAAELGGCDIFIPMASAGGGPASEETWKASYDIDLMSVFRGIDAAMPHLEKSDAASIVCLLYTSPSPRDS